jgi:hypothetical protein
MNNAGIWMAQKAEWEAEDPEGLNKFLEKHRRECLESYPDGEEVRYCSICGEPLKYGSMSYDEGWHFDSCL